MEIQKNILSDDFFLEDKINGLSENDKQFHKVFIEFGGIVIVREDDEASKIVDHIINDLKPVLKDGLINVYFPDSNKINLGAINSNKPFAISKTTTSLNVGLSKGLIIGLHKLFFGALSTNNFWKGYGKDYNCHLDTLEFIDNLDEVISSEKVLFPNCDERAELASVLTNIAIMFIIGHETTHAMDHQDFIDKLESILKIESVDQIDRESLLYKIIELDADRFGCILSFRLAHYYYEDEYSDRMDGPTYLWLSSIVLLYNYWKNINKDLKFDLYSMHPNWSIRWGFIISFFKMYLEKTQDFFDDCYDIDLINTIEEKYDDELYQFVTILEDRDNHDKNRKEYELILRHFHEINPFLRIKQ